MVRDSYGALSYFPKYYSYDVQQVLHVGINKTRKALRSLKTKIPKRVFVQAFGVIACYLVQHIPGTRYTVPGNNGIVRTVIKRCLRFHSSVHT